MNGRAGSPAHLLVGFFLGAGTWAVVGLATLHMLGPDVLTVLLAVLLAVALAVAVVVGALAAAEAAAARRRRALTVQPWPGRMA